MAKIVLITGSAGLIGSEASRYFLERGFDVVGIDNDMRRYFFGDEASTAWSRALLEEKHKNYKHYDVDIRDEKAIDDIFSNHVFDLIIHTAAQPSHDWAAREPLTDFSVNATGTLNILEAYRKYSPEAVFIFTSTNKVYGDRPNLLPLIELDKRYEIDPSHQYKEGIDETMSLDDSKHSIFGVSKVAADVMVQEYGKYFGLRTGVFRGGCLTGPGHSGAELHGFLAYLAKCIAEGRPYTIYGYKGKQVRDNIHSYDLITMFHEFYKNPRPGEVYNVGGSRHSNVSMMEAIEKIETYLGKKGNISYSDENRSGDHIWYVSDVSKFKKHYPDWKYTYGINEIIEEICDRWEMETKSKKMNSILGQKIAVVTHEHFKGSGQELRDFLNKKGIDTLYYVAHKFFYTKGEAISYLNIFKRGKLVKEKKSPVLPRNEFLFYFRDAFYNIWYFLTSKEKFDLYIGVDSFNAIFGLLLKKLGKVRKVAFFTIDYVMENRFKVGLLNKVYVWMDRAAFFGSDYTLNVSDRMARQRIQELGEKAKEKHQITVPIGVVKQAGEVKIERKDNILVYSGGLTPEFGLELIIESMPALLKKFPDLRLRIIGDGELKGKLESMADKLGVSKNVDFMGFIDTTEDRERWLSLLKESTLGLATYEDTKTTYKRFSDVTKPKDYMSCGLPIITTSVIPLSEDIKKQNLGRVVEYNVDSFVMNVSELLGDGEERKKIEQNVYNFSHNMTWDNIFKRMFGEMEISA